jgi:hypothetical protein
MAEFLLLALLLGIKHSFDADHLLAVSNILTKPRSIIDTLKLTTNWTLGHIGGAVFVTIILFTFKDSLFPIIFEHFEFLVAIMLIGFGLFGLYQARFLHSHEHKHGDEEHQHMHIHLKNDKKDHSHKHILGIGLVQGLASNDELLLLLTMSLGVAGLFDMVLGVVVFSIGVLLGMIAFSLLFSLKANSLMLNRTVNVIVGAASIIYGSMMLFGL